MIHEESTGNRPAQMVWASIWLDRRGRPRRSPLIIMERDPDSPRNGYSANSYIKALEKGLQPYYKPGEIYMQDNARIHTAAKTRGWLESRGVWVMDWPPYSPDLNPIEHLWFYLKKLMYKHYPQFNNLKGGDEEMRDFCKALQRCWLKIPNSLILKLLLSVPRRLEACRASKGRQTKY